NLQLLGVPGGAPSNTVSQAQLATLLDQDAQRAMGLGASVPIHVTDANVEGLVLTLTTGVTVQGKLIVEGQPVSAVPNLDQLRLNIRKAVPLIGVGLTTSSGIAADGRFQVAGLRQDEYRAQLIMIPP